MRVRPVSEISDAGSTPAFPDLEELARLVARFEDGTLPAERWDHGARLAVALWYLVHDEEWRATERFLRASRRYHRLHGLHSLPSQAVDQGPGGAYHETATLFWLAIARRHLRRGRDGPVLELTNQFLRRYGHCPDLILKHYREETLFSDEARYFWVRPDLEPLESL